MAIHNKEHIAIEIDPNGHYKSTEIIAKAPTFSACLLAARNFLIEKYPDLQVARQSDSFLILKRTEAKSTVKGFNISGTWIKAFDIIPYKEYLDDNKGVDLNDGSN